MEAIAGNFELIVDTPQVYGKRQSSKKVSNLRDQWLITNLYPIYVKLEQPNIGEYNDLNEKALKLKQLIWKNTFMKTT